MIGSYTELFTVPDVVDRVISMHGYMLRPVGRGLSPAPSVQDDPLGAFQAARADVQAVLDDPEFAGTECDTPPAA
jgi:hypothetical protein